MLARLSCALCVLVAGACSSDRGEQIAHEFALCSDSPAHLSRISIDYAELYGLMEDTGAPVTKCGAGATACISLPFLFSGPPRLPEKPRETVRWSVDNDQFSLQLIPGSDDTYFLEAIDFRPAPDGRVAQYGKLLYVYNRDVGIISLRVEGDTPHGWVRCGGRLTFDDLHDLIARLPKPGSARTEQPKFPRTGSN
jgi:hypothetical protein